MKWTKIKSNLPPVQAEDESTEPKFIIQQGLSEVTPQGNKIYFYSDITRDTILALNRQIDETSKQMKILQVSYNLTEAPPIELHICSDGGDVFAGMSAMDKIINNSVPIHTYCEGMVASAATFLSVAGKKRFITKSSVMLIHQVSAGCWGKYSAFKDEMENLHLIMELIKAVYLKKTKFKEKELEGILSHDICLGADKCLKLGLVDVII